MEAKKEKGDRDFSFFRAGEILPPATGSLRMAPILRLQEIQERAEGRRWRKSKRERERKRERELSARKEEGTRKKERARFARRVGRTEQTDRSLIYGDHTSDI